MDAQTAQDSLHDQQDFEPHPFAEILPLIEGEEFAALVKSVSDHGLLNPILIFEGRILDGRNRYRACKAADRPFYSGEVLQFAGNAAEALDLVEAQNLHRRQLTQSQRAMAAASLATLRRGLNKEHGDETAFTVSEAAERLNVSEFLVKQARRVRKEASPNIVAMVERGELPLAAANKIAQLPLDRQSQFSSGEEVRAFLYPANGEKQARKITAGMVTRTFGDLADLIAVPADQVVALLDEDDRSALADLIPQYVMFLESLRSVLAGGGGCQAAG